MRKTQIENKWDKEDILKAYKNKLSSNVLYLNVLHIIQEAGSQL